MNWICQGNENSWRDGMLPGVELSREGRGPPPDFFICIFMYFLGVKNFFQTFSIDSPNKKFSVLTSLAPLPTSLAPPSKKFWLCPWMLRTVMFSKCCDIMELIMNSLKCNIIIVYGWWPYVCSKFSAGILDYITEPNFLIVPVSSLAYILCIKWIR